MGRTAKDKRPHLPPVEHIELNQENVKRRIVAAVLLLLFGGGMLAYAFMQLLSPGDTGWITVEAGSSVGASCGSEFTFLYLPGTGEKSYASDQKAVTALYTQLCRDAFELFHEQEVFEGVNNVCAINRHPNEILEVDEGLYKVFSAVERSGSRALYLGPVYSRYDDLFSCDNDSQLVDFDPRLSGEVAREYEGVLTFAGDPEAVRIELLGENTIRLAVSEEYLVYADREEIQDFIGFSWMRNAFIADFLADGLAGQGYTNGVLSSYDGFVRNLDGSGTGYSLQIYDRRETNIYTAAVMGYQGPVSIVSLRDYPLSEQDKGRFYILQNGEIRTLYLDPADALCKSAVHDLTGYARDKGCGEILLALSPVYIAGELRTEELVRLSEEGVESVFCQDGAVRYTDPAAEFRELYGWEDGQYAASPLKS